MKLFFKKILIFTNLSLIMVSAYPQGKWIQKGADIDGEAAQDLSGQSICMPDANTIAIGAPENDGKATRAGHVRIYRWNGSAWIQKGADIDGASTIDLSGSSVCMPDSNNIAIGSPGNNNGTGQVRVFSWNGKAWVQKGSNINGKTFGDKLGSSVSMPDSNTLAIGAPGAKISGIFGTGIGYARVFNWNGNNWIQQGSDLPGEKSMDAAGTSVSMPDAYTISYNASSGASVNYWKISQKDFIQDLKDRSNFGALSVSMPERDRVAIGSPSGLNAGRVRVFDRNVSDWEQQGSDILGEHGDDQFGFSVSMPDWRTVGIGAPRNNSIQKYAGLVKVYSWELDQNLGWIWIQKGNNIRGEAEFDESGYSISMPDSNTIAIGARGNSGKASQAGHVRVFTFCRNTTARISKNTCYQYVSPSGKYTWTQSGEYYDTIPKSGGCDSIITINLTVNNPDVSIKNTSPTLSANATGAIYQWLDCSNGFSEISGANKQSYTATSNGNYAVRVTKNGCTDTSACIAITNVSILENSFGEALKIFPNPTHGDVNIELGANYNDLSVIVRNATGQEVLRKSFSDANSLQINIPGEPGFYTVEVAAQDKKALLKVMKK